MRLHLRGLGAALAPPIVAYHGAHRWEGLEREVRASPSARQAWGPGLYLTTSAWTARRYAKGGGAVLRFELEPDIRWLHRVNLDVDEMLACARALPRNRKPVIASLERLRREALSRGVHEVYAEALVIAAHNAGALAGAGGVAVVNCYLRHGIDAALERSRGPAGDEDWILLYNTAKVRSWRRLSTAEQVGAEMVAPRVVG